MCNHLKNRGVFLEIIKLKVAVFRSFFFIALLETKKNQKMKKTLLTVAVVLAAISADAQNLLSQNFDTFPGVAAPGTNAQWVQTNQSSPAGASTWAQGGGTAFTGAQAGAATSFTLCNFNSTTGAGIISNWLIAPVVDLQPGDVISFWTRQGGTVSQFPDRLEMRFATDWSDFSALPTGGSTGLGDFTNLAVSVNPDLTVTGYPLTWTNYTFTYPVDMPAGPVRIAFRYFVTDGGPSGNNSNIIGLDTFSIDRPLSTESFFASNYTVFPNPTSGVLNIGTKGASMNQIQISDINGRTVKTINAANVSETQINISDLNSGVYFLKISSDSGVGTTKIVKS